MDFGRAAVGPLSTTDHGMMGASVTKHRATSARHGPNGVDRERHGHDLGDLEAGDSK